MQRIQNTAVSKSRQDPYSQGDDSFVSEADVIQIIIKIYVTIIKYAREKHYIVL